MQLTLQTQLFPDAEQERKLAATISAFNAAADWLADEAFALRSANKLKLQQLYYSTLRERFGLSSQMAVRCIAEVCGAYRRDKSKRPRFREFAAVPYDQRLMSFKGEDGVSLLTLEGRVIVRLVMGQYQRQRLGEKYGQCDLLRRRDGKWFLLVTVDVAEKTRTARTDFLGVDFGFYNLATDSDGESHTDSEVEQRRLHYQKVRRSLQRKAAKEKRSGQRPKSVRRKLKALSGRERRFKKNTNHKIAKLMVEKAIDTRRGIAIEDLRGIRESSRFRQSQRDRQSKWAYAELRTFVEYKARLGGVEVVAVDPRNTSKTCSQCGHLAVANRERRYLFLCRGCGYFNHADVNAALNISKAAAVMQREASERAVA
jgi:IS605 OrfB family transposase